MGMERGLYFFHYWLEQGTILSMTPFPYHAPQEMSRVAEKFGLKQASFSCHGFVLVHQAWDRTFDRHGSNLNDRMLLRINSCRLQIQEDQMLAKKHC